MENQTRVEDLFFHHGAEEGGAGALQKFTDCGAKSLRLETLLDDMDGFPANTTHSPLSPGLQFPVNFAI